MWVCLEPGNFPVVFCLSHICPGDLQTDCPTFVVLTPSFLAHTHKPKYTPPPFLLLPLLLLFNCCCWSCCCWPLHLNHTFKKNSLTASITLFSSLSFVRAHPSTVLLLLDVLGRFVSLVNATILSLGVCVFNFSTVANVKCYPTLALTIPSLHLLRNPPKLISFICYFLSQRASRRRSCPEDHLLAQEKIHSDKVNKSGLPVHLFLLLFFLFWVNKILY